MGDLLFPTGELLDLAERGTIHSNIPDTGEHEVVDADSGRLGWTHFRVIR